MLQILRTILNLVDSDNRDVEDRGLFATCVRATLHIIFAGASNVLHSQLIALYQVLHRVVSVALQRRALTRRHLELSLLKVHFLAA